MGAHSVTGAGVECPGQQVDDLLYMFYVHSTATAKILYVHTGEAERVCGFSQAGIVGQGVRVCPGHVDGGC